MLPLAVVMPMLALAVLLWAPVAAAVAEEEAGCEPSIQRLNDTSGGGWTLLLGAHLTPSCHCRRHIISHRPCPQSDLDLECGSSSWTVPGLQKMEFATDRVQSRVTVRLAGWYSVRCCNGNEYSCNSNPEAKIWVDGINYSTWNVSISPQQTAGDSPRLSVQVTRQMDPSTDLQFYLPELFVFLRNATTDNIVENSGRIGYPENNSYEFGLNKSLAPGRYKIEVKPQHFDCGSSCKVRYLFHSITAPKPPSVGHVTVDTTPRRTLYLSLGVPAGLALVLLAVFISYRLRRFMGNMHGASHKPPPGQLAPSGPVSVLLLHRGSGGGELDGLRAALRSAGIILLDARDPSVLNLMQTYSSPAELLALEAFRDARLLFVGGGDGDPAGSVSAQVYDNVLRFVRNGRLGLDYGRVYSATLGDAPGDELAGLVEGRLFRVPDDVPTLIEHLLYTRRPTLERINSTESRTDLLPAMAESAVSTAPDLQPSAV